MTTPDKKVVYMDNNATSQVAPEVLETMMPYLTEAYGNPSSMHTFGGWLIRKGCWIWPNMKPHSPMIPPLSA